MLNSIICSDMWQGVIFNMFRNKTATSTEMDMCSGPLFSKIIIFSIPVILTGVLQMLYNAADQAVVGRFAGSDALAAVGSTSSLFNLLVCTVTGLATGTSTIVSRFYGAQDHKSVSRAVHTSMVLSVISSVIIGIFGFIFAKNLLVLMGTDKEVLSEAALYMRILFIGLPFLGIFNFGTAILRAVGDSKRPLYFLTISGITNVILNLLFVIVFKMRADGVALATVISQVVSAVLCVLCLIKADGCYKLCLKKLRLHKKEARLVIGIGIPAAIQSSMFSISNVILQSSVNSLGKAAVSGTAAAATIENTIYQVMHGLYLATISFCSQNFGAKNYKRLLKAMLYCYGIVTVLGILTGGICYIFRGGLIGIFINDNPCAYSEGLKRMMYTCPLYFICGAMEVGGGALRSINRPIHSMINSVIGACIFRIFWVYTVFAASPSLDTLYLSYPISWTLTAVLHIAFFIFFFAKLKKEA